MWKREFGEEIKYSVPGILLNRSKKTLTERRRLLNIMVSVLLTPLWEGGIDVVAVHV